MSEVNGALRLGMERVRYYEVDGKVATNVTRKTKEPKNGKGNANAAPNEADGK